MLSCLELDRRGPSTARVFSFAPTRLAPTRFAQDDSYKRGLYAALKRHSSTSLSEFRRVLSESHFSQQKREVGHSQRLSSSGRGLFRYRFKSNRALVVTATVSATAGSVSGTGRVGGSYPMDTFTEPKTITFPVPRLRG